jgi:DNA topoisomerase-1
MKESLTSPPSRYNESSLVETLEKNSIGRPSTYATMISKVQEKDYVRQQNVEGIEKSLKEIIYENNKLSIKDVKMFLGKENNRLVPTNLGKKITDFLNINFPQLMDIQFTSNLEQDLDEIANAKKNWIDVLRTFYEILDSQIKNFLKTATPQTKNLKSCTNNELIGLHPETNQNIIYTKTKYGFALKMFNQEENKDIWLSVKTKPKLEDAIELFKKKEEEPETKSTIIKKVDKYEIKDGPYGPYIQVKVGKSIKFFKIYGTKKPDELTLEDCKKLCVKKDYKKVDKKVDVKNDNKVENKVDNKKEVKKEKVVKKTVKKVSKKEV